MSQPHLHLSPEAIYPFDARGVAKRVRRAAIVIDFSVTLETAVERALSAGDAHEH